MSDSPKAVPPPKDPKVEAAHQEGFHQGWGQGADRALRLINCVLDGTDRRRLADGEVRSVGPASCRESFKEAETKIRNLQELVRLAIEKGRS